MASYWVGVILTGIICGAIIYWINPDIVILFLKIVAILVVIILIGIISFKITGNARDKRNHKKWEEDHTIINEHLNERRQWHSLTEPAITRKNGKQEYFIEGVWLDKDLWHSIVTKKMSVGACLGIGNIEQRRIAMKYCITPETFLDNWKEVRLVNKDKRGNWLYEYTHQNLNEPIKILVYKDPSTERTYYSFVPPEMINATRAMAWKFQLTEQEYDNLRFEA